MVKLLLISAIDPYSEVQARFPQLGLAYLASALQKEFPGEIEIKIINKDVTQELDTFRPDVVGISSVTQTYNYAKTYAKEAKSRGIPVIIGGMHISALPQSMTSDMDIAVIGEGEETIVDVMRSWMELGEFPSYARGTYGKDDAGVHLNPPRPVITPLDDISLPARDLLPIRRQSNLFSSRGCPYRCRFCFSSRYWDKLRFFSADYVYEEIVEMATRYGVRRFNFYDDLMIADRKRFETLAGNIRYYLSQYGFKFWMNARANLITDDTARLMKEMGVVSVGMGLESGNERTLSYLKGDSVTVADNYNAVQILHKYGIAATASFIIGSPDETEEEIMDTYRFIEDSGLDFVDTFPLTPFPNTPVWDDAMTRGLVSNDMDWSRFSVYLGPDSILMSKTIDQERMAQIYHKFKRQRLRLALKRAWFHPFFGEMVKAGAKKVFNSVVRASI